MDSGVKQRVIGACVLTAVAVIFLPTLLERPAEKQLDTNSQIPPEPSFTLHPHSPPQPPEGIDPPPPQSELFIPKEPEPLDEPNTVAGTEEPKAIAPLPEPPGLSESTGLPKSWVVQVASFKEKARADALVQKLRNDDYRAYSREATHLSEPRYRVFVGPKIDKRDAQKLKQELDKALNAQTLILEFAP